MTGKQASLKDMSVLVHDHAVESRSGFNNRILHYDRAGDLCSLGYVASAENYRIRDLAFNQTAIGYHRIGDFCGIRKLSGNRVAYLCVNARAALVEQLAHYFGIKQLHRVSIIIRKAVYGDTVTV